MQYNMIAKCQNHVIAPRLFHGTKFACSHIHANHKTNASHKTTAKDG